MNKELVLAIIEYVDAKHELATNPLGNFVVYQSNRLGEASKRILELISESPEEKQAVKKICGE